MSASNYILRRATLIAYLKLKVEQEDWHGASDACNDLRDMDAEQRGLLSTPQSSLSDDLATLEQLRQKYAP